jgi:hypothetical protein
MVNGTRIIRNMDLTTEEIQVLRNICDKYKPLCGSFLSCSDCPMDYIVIDSFEHCLERFCFVASIERLLCKYK